MRRGLAGAADRCDTGIKELAVKSYAFLFWAYNVVWIGIAGYLLCLGFRLRRIDRRLDNLERESDG
jgi:CcmD family protein